MWGEDMGEKLVSKPDVTSSSDVTYPDVPKKSETTHEAFSN